MFDRERPKVSIILPSWFMPGQNGKYGDDETFWLASECLRRMLAVTKKEDYELIIVDNGSKLEQRDLLASNSRFNIKIEPERLAEYWDSADILIRNKENLGFGPGANEGFKVARGKYIVCLNNDILLWSGWLEAMMEPFSNEELSPPAGVVMTALCKETGDAIDALNIESVNLKANYDKLGPGAEFGSCWMSTKKILDQLKEKDGYVFDENFKLGFGEDRDLWDRIRVAGYETYRTHKTRVFHQGNMSMTKFAGRHDYTVPNRAYLASKRAEREDKKNL